jgi:2-polyprenyl-3-methyl-5-hydroxy-6-metoxy-1,4-benzoquinol methylase
MTDIEKWRLLCEEMQARYPVLASVWLQAIDRFGDNWVAECIFNLETIYGSVTSPLSEEVIALLDGYAEFSYDALRNQVYYERTGRYRASSYEEVSRECYHNPDYMNRRYLPGMIVSHFVWPQHYHMQKGFKTLLLPRVRSSRLFFEVGVGCGLYSKITLEALPHVKGVGFDISQFALDFTGQILEKFGLAERYSLANLDIRHGYSTTCDFLICQEVLEHLEQPAEFCRWLRNLIKPGGYAYITAALNAAHSDHIYLFHTPTELEEMLRAAGLRPLHGHEEFAPGFKPRNFTPSLSGFLCQRTT